VSEKKERKQGIERADPARIEGTKIDHARSEEKKAKDRVRVDGARSKGKKGGDRGGESCQKKRKGKQEIDRVGLARSEKKKAGDREKADRAKSEGKKAGKERK
jgi:hypothetical protein